MSVFDRVIDDGIAVDEQLALSGNIAFTFSDVLVAIDYAKRSAEVGLDASDVCATSDHTFTGNQYIYEVLIQDTASIQESPAVESGDSEVYILPTPEEQGKARFVSSPGYSGPAYDDKFTQHETKFRGPGYISIS